MEQGNTQNVYTAQLSSFEAHNIFIKTIFFPAFKAEVHKEPLTQ